MAVKEYLIKQHTTKANAAENDHDSSCYFIVCKSSI